MLAAVLGCRPRNITSVPSQTASAGRRWQRLSASRVELEVVVVGTPGHLELFPRDP
jgi:hypothetical protein